MKLNSLPHAVLLRLMEMDERAAFWVDEAAEVTVQTVNARRVAVKMRTRKNRQNLVGK